MNNTVKLAMLGRTSIAVQLDEGHWIAVKKNTLMGGHEQTYFIEDHCVKFCGAFELALRGYNETASSGNPGISRFCGITGLCVRGALEDRHCL